MEIVVPALISKLETIDSGEIRLVQFTVPPSVEVQGQQYEIRDSMRPGTAFMAKPWGMRTGKVRRRMYSRSNTAHHEPRILETIINHTHQARTDTSAWWQSQEPEAWYRDGKPIDIRVTLDMTQGIVNLYESAAQCKSNNLRLEEEENWQHHPMVCVAFGTGVTPFLAYARYMAAHHFGRADQSPGMHLSLFVSVRHARQLMLHEELLAIAAQFPNNFFYYPVLTRTWPSSWAFGKGRIMQPADREEQGSENRLLPHLNRPTHLSGSHLRICGNREACRQLETVMTENGIHPLSVRTESW